MSPEHPEEDEFLEDDEQEEYGQRSIFATGWFRAVLVLLVLAVIAVIAVPLIGGWFEPTPPVKSASKPSEPAPTLAPTPSTPPPAAAPTPSAETPSASAPSASRAPAVAPPATSPPAAAPTPAPPPAMPAPARPEMPASAASKAVEKPAEKTKPAEHVAAATPGKSARPATGGSYWVQVGAFKQSGNAEGLAKRLRAEGFPVQVARVTREEALHVVRVGGYPDRPKATAAREELQGKGHAGFITQGPVK